MTKSLPHSEAPEWARFREAVEARGFVNVIRALRNQGALARVVHEALLRDAGSHEVAVEVIEAAVVGWRAAYMVRHTAGLAPGHVERLLGVVLAAGHAKWAASVLELATLACDDATREALVALSTKPANANRTAASVKAAATKKRNLAEAAARGQATSPEESDAVAHAGPPAPKIDGRVLTNRRRIADERGKREKLSKLMGGNPGAMPGPGGLKRSNRAG